MQVISLDEAKNNIESIFDSVRLDKEEVVVYHKDRDSVVIIPLEEYNSIKETKYLRIA